MWRSRKAFEADFFASYRNSGLQQGATIQPMGATLIDMQAKTHVIKLPKKVASALSVLDDLMLDAIIWYHSVAIVIWNDEPALNRHFERAIMALFMRVAQDAITVRNLIQAGFDVQAKNILRSIDEHVDAIYFLCIQPSACEEFTHTNDDESANRFWWKHLRKARTTINKMLLERIKHDEYIKELVEFRNSERTLLSATHHPSYVACTMPFLVPYRSVNVTKYLFGLPSEQSLRTGKFLFYILAEAAIICTAVNKDMERLIARDGDGPLPQLIRQGRKHLATMLLHLVENWSCPLFAMSRQFEALMERLPKDDIE